MLKGAQKRMIVIKTGDSEIFEEAHFLVKPNFDGEELDMLAEANRIASANMMGAKGKRARMEWVYNLLFGLFGGAVGMLLGFLGCLLLKIAV